MSTKIIYPEIFTAAGERYTSRTLIADALGVSYPAVRTAENYGHIDPMPDKPGIVLWTENTKRWFDMQVNKPVRPGPRKQEEQ